MPQADSPFQSFFIGGFECSTHYLPCGRRLDMIAATKHDAFCLQDYRRLNALGIRMAREGVRWHLVEQQRQKYDFSSAMPMLQAAKETGTQVIWDLCHYGWPDGIDIFKSEFVSRFAKYAKAFAQFLGETMGNAPLVTPVNEISFFSWGGGDTAKLNPYCYRRGAELKAQLVRATIEGIEAFWEVLPKARIVTIDPIIHIATHPKHPQDRPHVDAYNNAQYQSWDMLAGRISPELGGSEKYLDLMGVNYYWNNQWVHRGRPMGLKNPLYRPFREMLCKFYERYKRPFFIAETGIENERRPRWLRYIGREVRAAQRAGADLKGICLYPILNHPGWNDDRHCHNGLWDYADQYGERKEYKPLAQELKRQISIFERLGR